MESLRVVLVIIGLLIILALLGHGLWTIRKNNQLAKGQRESLERKRRRAEPDDLFSQMNNVDPEPDSNEPAVSAGGVKSAAAAERKVSAREKIEPTVEQMEIDLNETGQEPEQAELSGFSPLQTDDDNWVVSPEEEPQAPEMTAVHDNSNINETLVTDDPVDDYVEAEKKGTDEAEPAEQETQAAETQAPKATEPAAPQPEAEQDKQGEDDETPDMEVITLYITGDIQGAILLQMTSELGLKYGDMEILHRHQEPSGHGPVLFSLANMYKPGTFDINNMEQFATDGIVLFLTLPLESDGHQAFTMMYNAANKIADAMPRAAVLDGNRNPMTKQSVQHIYQRIREFERRQRLQRSSQQR